MTDRPPFPAVRPLPLLWPVLIFGATLAAYWPALRADFIWNDSDYVTAPALQSWSGLRQIWFHFGATQQYYPVLHSAFWLEHRLWGDSPLPYHLLNVLLHATAACLFARLVADAVRLSPAALLAGLLFALHPVGAESVAWITEEKNTLSTVFYLLAAILFLRWREARGRTTAAPGLYWLALALFAAASLSKSVAATLPGALLVVLWWRRGRLSAKDDVLPLLPWLALGAAAGLVTGWVEQTYIGARGEGFSLNVAERLLLAGRVPAFYLGKLLWPAHLVFIYPRWTVDVHASWQWLFPLGWLGVLGMLAWRIRTVRPSPFARGAQAALLLFLGGLFPLLGLFNIYAFIFSYVADHWQYLAMLGIIAAIAGAWGSWRDRSAGQAGPLRYFPTAAAAAVLGTCGALTWKECRGYHDPETFFRTILQRNPASWMAHNNLGNLLLLQAKLPPARAEFEEALRLHPRYVEAEINLASYLRLTGKPAEGIPHCEAALRLAPDYAASHEILGQCLYEAGRPAEAIAELRTALRLKPDLAEAHDSLGIALAEAGQTEAGIAEIERAVQLHPAYPEMLNHLGLVLDRGGRRPEAIARYREALRLRPDLAEAHGNLGLALAELGRIPEAVVEYRTALRLAPESAEVHNNLGNVLVSTGHLAEGTLHLQEAARLRPNAAAIHRNLVIVLNAQGRTAEAKAELEAAERASRTRP